MTKHSDSQPVDMDDLLSSDPAFVPDLSSEETPAQRRIRELEEELSKPAPEYPEEPNSGELTEEEKMILDLEDKLAKKQAAESEAAPLRFQKAGNGEKILLHFVEDGFTFSGTVWFRGQEVEFEIGSEAHKQQQDRNGDSWIDLADDAMAQIEKYGQRYFASGPWQGRPWGDTTGLTSEQDILAVQSAAKAEKRRNRAAPIF